MPNPDPNPTPSARLEVICGPMFAGKTTELLRRIAQALHAGERVAVYKPASDQRYSTASIVSHGGEAIPARAVNEAEEIPASLGEARVVAIDEAHFFGRPLSDVCARLLDLRKRIIVAGVERDHTGRPFEPFPTLLCEADEVVKLSGPCARCGRPAVHSQRMIEGDGRIVVGGAGMYQARCRACFRIEERGSDRPNR